MRRGRSTGAQFSDLAFLLIVFFLVLAGSLTLEQMTLALERPGLEQRRQYEAVLVRIESDGSWLVDGKRAEEKDIFLPFDSTISENNQGMVLILSVHDEAPWQSLASLLQAAGSRDIDSVHMEALQ